MPVEHRALGADVGARGSPQTQAGTPARRTRAQRHHRTVGMYVIGDQRGIALEAAGGEKGVARVDLELAPVAGRDDGADDCSVRHQQPRRLRFEEYGGAMSAFDDRGTRRDVGVRVDVPTAGSTDDRYLGPAVDAELLDPRHGFGVSEDELFLQGAIGQRIGSLERRNRRRRVEEAGVATRATELGCALDDDGGSSPAYDARGGGEPGDAASDDQQVHAVTPMSSRRRGRRAHRRNARGRPRAAWGGAVSGRGHPSRCSC
jgi:hypothetical protein